MRPPRLPGLFEAFANVVPFQQVSCGLGVRKAETLRHIARAIVSGEASEDGLSRMTSAESLRVLTTLPGIGPWSASLLLLRGLGRLDVFPAGDVGAAHGLAQLTRRSPGPALQGIIQSSGSSRGDLYFCARGGALLAKQLITAAA